MKTRFLILFLLCSIIARAERPKFGWNKSIEAGLGYSHIYKSLGSDWYGTEMPTDVISIDVILYGIYFGASAWEKDTGHYVYGYRERVTTYDFKFGPSFRTKWEKSKLSFTPYVGWVSFNVDDSSGNAIGQRQDYGEFARSFEVGGRIAYAYKFFEVAAHASNLTCGVTVGVNLDW